MDFPVEDTYMLYPIGSRIKIGHVFGTVKYVGEVEDYPGVWLGIEWDDPKRGKHGGSIEGKHYFHTQHPRGASFVNPALIGPCTTLAQAARERYSSGNIFCTEFLREEKNALGGSHFQFIGFDKVTRKQSELEQLTEISVDHCPVNSAGCLKAFQNLQTLHANSTLIWNWHIVADILKQLPTLLNLDLGCNRLLLPTDAEMGELKPKFKNLQSINLRNFGYQKWKDVVQTARIWPQIQVLSLQENPLSKLYEVNCEEVFKNLRELSLCRTKIGDFAEVCKLGNICTLTSLNLLNCDIGKIKLPECEPNEKLQIFASLEQLNLLDNPIRNENDAFNELDKLPKLRRLNMTTFANLSFAEIFSRAVGRISKLEAFNKVEVCAQARRSADCDMWKLYAPEWLEVSNKPDLLHEFNKKHRTYAGIVKKFGSPEESIPVKNTDSKFIKIFIRNPDTGELLGKKVPPSLTVGTLQCLIAKCFGVEKKRLPHLSYIDGNHPGLEVPMENPYKTLSFYSIENGNIILVEWIC